MNDIFFHGTWRMDWGFGNPNKTAAFISILMIAVWGVAYVWRHGFWIALVSFVGLGFALIHTFSRGGLVSLSVGLIPLLVLAPKPWPSIRVAAIVASFGWMLVASIYLKADERYSQGILTDDHSISNRLAVWNEAPAMIMSAPKGWGIGGSGNAFRQWYQPLDRNEIYRTLINSHLTWLVEFGWPFRILYIFGWSGIFLLCWPSMKARWLSISLGVWLCFFVAAFFSSVAEEPLMWIFPVLYLCAALLFRIYSRIWPRWSQWAIPISTTTLIVSFILIFGKSVPPIAGSPGLVIIGGGNPVFWICYDKANMGALYGREIRSFRQTFPSLMPSVGLILLPQVAPHLSKECTLILGGDLPSGPNILKSISNVHHLVLLNPKFFPQEVGINSINRNKVVVYFGEFCQSPSSDAWRALNVVKQISGSGEFLPNWLQLIFDPSRQ